MKNKFYFIVLAAHGSGINAFVSFLNQIENLQCLKSGSSVEDYKNFLKSNFVSYKGCVIDKTTLLKNNILEYILQNISQDCILITIMRDPLQRLKSVMNTHILWWAETVSGTYCLNLKNDMLYKNGDEKSFLSYLLNFPTMNTVVELYKMISHLFVRKLFYDISDLYPENAVNALQPISEIFFGKKLDMLYTSKSLPFSRDNLFVKHIAPLSLSLSLSLSLLKGNIDVMIKPCPVEFLSFYGYSIEDVLLEIDPAEYNFTLGNFNGQLALVIDKPKYISIDEICFIKEYLLNHADILSSYIDNISLRHNFASKLAKYMYITNEKIRYFIVGDKTLHLSLENFLGSQIIFASNTYPHLTEYWQESIEFYNNLCKKFSDCNYI